MKLRDLLLFLLLLIAAVLLLVFVPARTCGPNPPPVHYPKR